MIMQHTCGWIRVKCSCFNPSWPNKLTATGKNEVSNLKSFVSNSFVKSFGKSSLSYKQFKDQSLCHISNKGTCKQDLMFSDSFPVSGR